MQKTDYENIAADLLFPVTDDIEVRTDRAVFEIVLKKPLARKSQEYTHKAVSLGRFGTLEALSRALLTKVAVHYDAGSQEHTSTAAFLAHIASAQDAIVDGINGVRKPAKRSTKKV